jgi:hypothetical protein
MSLHQTYIVKITIVIDENSNKSPYIYEWKYITPPTVIPKAPNEPT